MAHPPDRRHGPDRRRQPRSGRRDEDRDGFTPLVLVVGEKPGVVDRSEAILAKLRFAVCTSGSVEEALRMMSELRPELVVASEWDGARIRSAAPQHPPVVVMTRGMQDSPDLLIEQIRRTLRDRST